MTIQVKHYIELSDLVSLRIVCNHCQATLILPLSDHKLREEPSSNMFLAACPNCHQAWTDSGGSSYEPLVRTATAGLARLLRIMEGETKVPLGFKLTFEVKAEPGNTLAKSSGTQV